MKFKMFGVLFLACCVLFSAPASFGEQQENEAQSMPESQTGPEPDGSGENLPIAFVASDKFEFSSVIEGSDVTNDFIIQNQGTAPLTIEKVKTG